MIAVDRDPGAFRIAFAGWADVIGDQRCDHVDMIHERITGTWPSMGESSLS
jgi:hypothetical protein